MPTDAIGRLLRVGLIVVQDDADACARRDLSANAPSFLAVWVAPIVAASALSLPVFPASTPAAAWTIAFIWMGAACLLNARRCGRVHCYVSGPILLIGALLAGALVLGVVEPGQYALAVLVAATLLLAALSYGLELVWGRYRRST